MPRKGKCFSTCRTRPKTECVPPECHYTNGKKYKYCRLSYTRKMGPDCKPVLRILKTSRSKKNRQPNTPPPKQPSLPSQHSSISLSDIKPSKQQIQEVLGPVIDAKDLVLPEPIRVPPHKKVKSELDFFTGQSNKFEKYLGIPLLGNLYYLYLFNKYKSKCITQDSARFASLGLYLRIYEKSMNKNSNLALYEHMQLIAKQICKCVNGGMKTIIIPFTFMFPDEWNNTSSHANLLIYRKVDNTIERFEPYGKSITPIYDKRVEEKLVEFCAILNKEFDRYKMQNIRYKSASEVCPYIRGFQTIEEVNRKKDPSEGGGYCLAWSMFFAELVLNNPEVPSAELLDMVMHHVFDKGGKKYLVNVIKGYAHHISEKLEKYYSMLFDVTGLYKRILENDNATLAKFRIQIKYIVDMEMKASIVPNFDATTEMQRIREELEQERREKLPNNIRINNLQMELGVYEKLDLLKNPSPVREVVSPLSKPNTKKNRKLGK